MRKRGLQEVQLRKVPIADPVPEPTVAWAYQVTACPARKPTMSVNQDVLPRRHGQDVVNGQRRTLVAPQLIDVQGQTVFPARRVPIRRLDLQEQALPQATRQASNRDILASGWPPQLAIWETTSQVHARPVLERLLRDGAHPMNVRRCSICCPPHLYDQPRSHRDRSGERASGRSGVASDQSLSGTRTTKTMVQLGPPLGRFMIEDHGPDARA